MKKIIIGGLLGLLCAANLYAQEQAFEGLNELLKKEAANKNLPLFSLILVDEKGVVWSGGVGKDAKNPNLIADGNMTYRIGSVSKLFTDIVVMQYVEQGILDLDAPVVTYLPDFMPDNPYDIAITLRMLMSHSSGLVREPPVGNYFDPAAPSLADTVKSLNETTLVYAPGRKVQYSNAGLAVVGRVLEKLSGESFASLLKNKLLKPLGMNHSAFIPEAGLLTNLPEAYMQSYHGERTVAPTFELGIAPAGSMYSTMDDLALFMGGLLKKGAGINGRILREDTLSQMWTPQTEIKSGRNRSFGIGFILGQLDGEKTVSHGGAIYGFATQLKMLPGKKIGVAIATNLDMANGAINRIADHALRMLLAHQEGRKSPDYAITARISEDKGQKLTGLYKNEAETIHIKRRFGDLYLERIGGLSLRLRNAKDKLVIDDIMTYSEDIQIADGKVIIFGAEYMAVTEGKPAPMPLAWAGLIGEYGFDHNILYISEKFGKLHALIEWGMEYPLIDLGGGVFKFPPSGLYPNEQLVFEKNDQGKTYNVSLNGIDFHRRAVGDVDVEVFQIEPVKPVSLLEQEALKATPPEEKGQFNTSDLVDVTQYGENITLDIRYAGSDNFLATPVYSSAHAFLQRPAAEALGRIAKNLQQKGYGLLVHDAYRPWYVTKIFWDATPEEGKIFVADPSQGSRHNRGAAIDLTLYDLKTGKPIEMVGLYDEMTERSFVHYPGGTSLQRWHRELLKDAMEAEGFKVYPYEWWHFDFGGWEKYRVQNDTFEALR
ncbi:MAG: serine hydrolase [Emcibacter sp.]|nr:serine hydrolase [Emcibacter sp.]